MLDQQASEILPSSGCSTNVSLTTLNLIASLVERTRFVETFRRNKKNVQVKFFDWRSDVEQPISGKDRDTCGE